MRPSRRPLILVVDDDPANRQLLDIMLGRQGCRVVLFESGDGVVEAARTLGPDLVLMDIEMPGLDGIEVTRRLRADPMTATTPVILVTGRTTLDDKVTGLDAGATDFVTKPFVPAELAARVRAAVRLKAAMDRLEDVQGVLVALANAVEAKDRHTEDHCNRLAGMAMELARAAGASHEDIEAIGYGAALHDVGKIGIPEGILHKPAALTELEWQQMRRHPVIGAAIIEPLRFGRIVAPIVRGHHERWDGAGYPDGLRAEAIPLGARVVAVVDTYDAITHDRPYRAGRDHATAMDILVAEAGRQLDPGLVGLFVEARDWQVFEVPDLDLGPRGLHPLAVA
ncbi:MAG TPA: HD domain-containing phosphohydrolase [Candidatus Limnocylindrales bacterium]